MPSDPSGAGRGARRPASEDGGRTAIRATGEDDGDEPSRGGLRRMLAPTAAAAIALLAVACGGGGPPTATGSTTVDKALAHAQCMRSHGAPHWPEPNNQGQFISTPQNHADFNAPAHEVRDSREEVHATVTPGSQPAGQL